MTAPQPVTADELATIRAHALKGGRDHAETTLRLVAEIERLRAQVARTGGVNHVTTSAGPPR